MRYKPLGVTPKGQAPPSRFASSSVSPEGSERSRPHRVRSVASSAHLHSRANAQSPEAERPRVLRAMSPQTRPLRNQASPHTFSFLRHKQQRRILGFFIATVAEEIARILVAIRHDPIDKRLNLTAVVLEIRGDIEPPLLRDVVKLQQMRGLVVEVITITAHHVAPSVGLKQRMIW